MAKKSSSAQARSQAQAKAQELRLAQEKKDKRNKLIAIIAVIVVAIILVGAIVAIFLQSNRSALDEGVRPGNTTEIGAITVGEGGAAGTTSAEEVPVVTIFLDYTCVYCGQFEQMYHDVLQEMATDGEITLEYRPVGAISNWSRAAARAAAIVAEREPDKFMDAHALLFDESSPNPNQVTAYLATAGLSADTLSEIEGNSYRRWIGAATEKAYEDFEALTGRQLGTPSILINGEVFEANWNYPEAFLGAISYVMDGGTLAEFQESLENAPEGSFEDQEGEAPTTDLEEAADADADTAEEGTEEADDAGDPATEEAENSDES